MAGHRIRSRLITYQKPEPGRSPWVRTVGTIASLFAVFVFVWITIAPSSAGEIDAENVSSSDNSQNNSDNAQEGAGTTGATDGNTLTIGGERVLLKLSPAGKWLELAPCWSSGKSALVGGGFVVLSVKEDGTVEELANSATGEGIGGDLRARKETRGLRPAHEGITGGIRYPLFQRDDDDDGQEDEDRLDGEDNDGDGKIDEDYAAAGDQMVVLSYESLDKDRKPLLRFHQECYAWTLPHIDGMVAMKLAVQNVGERTIENVHVGSLIQRQGVFSVSTQDLVPPENGTECLVSKGVMVSGDGSGYGEIAMAAVFFAEAATDRKSWLTGTTSSARHLGDLVRVFVAAGTEDGSENSPVREINKPDSGSAQKPEEQESEARMVYGVSPNLGTLGPGDELVVYAALLVVPSPEDVDDAIENAYRTVIGDGEHRMIPPPVSVKRRTLWGTFYRHDNSEEKPAGITITLEGARAKGIGADDINYISGVMLSPEDINETWNGDLEFTLAEKTSRQAVNPRGRVELHGRLKNGEFFDVLLVPDGTKGSAGTGEKAELHANMTETQFWAQPGSLDEEWLVGSPNPFRESTTIFYEVPAAVSADDGNEMSFANPVETSVKIYNVAGRLVSTLVDDVVSPGQYRTQWNAVDANGVGVASGVYYIKLQIGKKHITKRLTQLK